MKHLKLQHNYMSMKMKFHEQEFPSLSPQLGGNGQVRDGFGHILEAEKEEEEPTITDSGEDRKESESSVKNDRIAELEAQLEETKARLDKANKDKKSFDIPMQMFDYDEVKDSVIVMDETVFDRFVDEKCRARVNRDKRKTDMKNKMLDQVRTIERKKRDLSTDSLISLTFLDSPARRRHRSESTDRDGVGGDAKQSRISQSQSALS